MREDILTLARNYYAAKQPFSVGTAKYLPNGAEIIARAGQNNLWIVLCLWTKGATDERATWCCDDDGNAEWGHYFTDYGRAEVDWRARVSRGF